MNKFRNLAGIFFRVLRDTSGSALLELAISLPLLVVFVVGIFDFSGAFNQKQKIESAAQAGAIIAGAQPTNDIQTTNADPDSLHPVVTVIFNSLSADGVLPNSCALSSVPAPTQTSGQLIWDYKIPCGADILEIKINRGWIPTGATSTAVATLLTVNYPYHWRFNSAIQLLFPGANYKAMTSLSETAIVHNQL